MFVGWTWEKKRSVSEGYVTH